MSGYAVNWEDVSEETPRNNPAKIVIPIALIVALIVGVLLYFMSQQNMIETTFTGNYIIEGYYDLTPAQIRIIEIISGHAWNHGSEPNEAFDCLGKYGSTKTFKTFGFKGSNGNFIPTNLWMCFDKVNNEWYSVVTTVFEKVGENKVARLITAYRISRDIFPTIGDYIANITTRWGAVVVNYAINAEKIYIQPK